MEVQRNSIIKACWFTLIVMLALLVTVRAQAAVDITEVYVNGVKLSDDTKPAIIGGVTFVPIRAIGEALGYSFDYHTDTRMVDMNHAEKNVSIIMNLDSDTVIINNEQTAMATHPIVVDDRLLVPVRFVGEAVNAYVEWREGWRDEEDGTVNPNTVKIYCEHPVALGSGRASIHTGEFSNSASLSGQNGAETTMEATIRVAQFSGMEDEALQNSLNSFFDDLLYTSALEYDTEYKSQLNSESYNYECYVDYSVIYDKNGLLSVMIDGFVYTGGAHGSPSKYCVNADFNKSSMLTLSDLFKPDSDYAQKLMDEMNAIRLMDTSGIYKDVAAVEVLPGENAFYFSDDAIVLIYQPYDLSYYARGFVYFEIPLANLSDYLK